MTDEEKAPYAQEHAVHRDLAKETDSTVHDSENGDLDIDLEAWGEEHGYVLDVEVLKTLTPNWHKYQLTKDNRTVLIPQPSADRNDPLNWSKTTKHIILFVVAATAFLPD